MVEPLWKQNLPTNPGKPSYRKSRLTSINARLDF